MRGDDTRDAVEPMGESIDGGYIGNPVIEGRKLEV
jgi:hypothetical protein